MEESKTNESPTRSLALPDGPCSSASSVDRLVGILKGKIPEDADRHWLREARLAETKWSG